METMGKPVIEKRKLDQLRNYFLGRILTNHYDESENHSHDVFGEYLFLDCWHSVLYTHTGKGDEQKVKKSSSVSATLLVESIHT